MRKAALITGIIFTAFIVIGVSMKLAHIPGGSILLILGIGAFCVSFLPLHGIYRFNKAGSALEKTAAVFGVVAGEILAVGLLFATQHWPGGEVETYAGILLAAVFLILYFVSVFRPENTGKKFGAFDVLVVVFFGMLFLARSFSLTNAAEMHKKVEACQTLMKAETEQEQANELFAEEIITNDSLLRPGAIRFEKQTADLLNYLKRVKGELIGHSQGIDPRVADTMDVHLLNRPGDYDTPTHYLIGADPAYITGEAKEIKRRLSQYRAVVLPQQIKWDIDLGDVKHGDETGSWEWANFYHVPLIDVLATLTQLQVSVLEAEKETLDKKAFFKELL